ncbi:MAG TPA: methionyl-tRNA formyltransferase [Candidatus Paceibacterota bacterium]|nr:methionyl-tRNA formyltransferase [Candidatus Paceibacterota bacterium]
MKIVFFGTSAFAAPALKKLSEARYDIQGIITQPDQPAGRKKILTPPPVKEAALRAGFRIFQPATLKDDVFFEQFKSLEPELAVVAAYGKIIPQRYLEVPVHGFLNIHPSLLPRYRGPSPIQTALLNGDTETGITIMEVDAQMDHGPIIAQETVAIGSAETYPDLHDRLADHGAELLGAVIPDYVTGAMTPVLQDDSQATFCRMLTREDGKIDWSTPTEKIYNQIRALNPEPGTWTTWNGQVLNIKKASLQNGQLHIEIVQLAGKKETALKEFLQGRPDFKLSDLGR